MCEGNVNNAASKVWEARLLYTASEFALVVCESCFNNVCTKLHRWVHYQIIEKFETWFVGVTNVGELEIDVGIQTTCTAMYKDELSKLETVWCVLICLRLQQVE